MDKVELFWIHPHVFGIIDHELDIGWHAVDVSCRDLPSPWRAEPTAWAAPDSGRSPQPHTPETHQLPVASAHIVSLTLGSTKSLTKLNRPDTGPSPHVQTPPRLAQWCKEELLSKGHSEEVVLQVETVGFALARDQQCSHEKASWGAVRGVPQCFRQPGSTFATRVRGAIPPEMARAAYLVVGKDVLAVLVGYVATLVRVTAEFPTEW